MKILNRLLFFVFAALPAQGQTLCVRFPETSLNTFSQSGCEFDLEAALAALAVNPLPAKAYDTLLDRLDRNGQFEGKSKRPVDPSLWGKFIQDFSLQTWQDEDRRLLREVSESLRGPAKEAGVQKELQRFQFGRYRKVSATDHLENLPVITKSGAEDLQIQVLALEDETPPQLFQDPQNRHWILASSGFRPVFHWGNFQTALQSFQDQSKAWIEGDCRSPHWLSSFHSNQKIRAIDSKSCEAISESTPSQNLDLPNPVEIRPEKKLSWWWVALGGLALGAYALKDKKIVFTRGGP